MSKRQVLSVKMFILDPVCFHFPSAFPYLWLKQSLPGLSYCLSVVWDQISLCCQPGLASAMLKILFTALQRSTHVHSNRPRQQRQCRAAAASLLISGELQAQGYSWSWSPLSFRYWWQVRWCLLLSLAVLLKDKHYFICLFGYWWCLWLWKIKKPRSS